MSREQIGIFEMTLTEELLKKIAEEYIADKSKNNMSALSKKYRIPYPTLRRKLTEYLQKNDLDDLVREDYLPYEPFKYLDIGDTFQHDESLTIWEVVGYKKMDGENVIILVPTKKRARRHWIRRTLVISSE